MIATLELPTQRTKDLRSPPRDVEAFKDLAAGIAKEQTYPTGIKLSSLERSLRNLGDQHPGETIASFMQSPENLLYKLCLLSRAVLLKHGYALFFHQSPGEQPKVFFARLTGPQKTSDAVGGKIHYSDVVAIDNEAGILGITYQNVCLVDKEKCLTEGHNHWGMIRNEYHNANPYLKALDQLLVKGVTSPELSDKIVYGLTQFHEMQHGFDNTFVHAMYAAQGINFADSDVEIIADCIAEDESPLKQVLTFKTSPNVVLDMAHQICEASAYLGSLDILVNNLMKFNNTALMKAAFLYFCGWHHQNNLTRTLPASGYGLYPGSRIVGDALMLDSKEDVGAFLKQGPIYISARVKKAYESLFLSAEVRKNR